LTLTSLILPLPTVLLIVMLLLAWLRLTCAGCGFRSGTWIIVQH
jgi:hypothetical protein